MSVFATRAAALSTAGGGVGLPGYDHRYVAITTRLRSLQSFCDFLANGGVVRVAPADGLPFEDVTAIQLQRNRREAEALARLRRQLFPDLADEDVSPSLYSSDQEASR